MDIAAKVKPEDFFTSEFERRAWPDISLILRQAHAASRELYNDTLFMQTPSGLQNFGTLYAVATDFGLERAIKDGWLPWDYQ